MMNKPEKDQEFEEGAVDDLDKDVEQESEPEQAKGYRSKEQWEAEGNDPEDYVSKDVWEAKGEWLKTAGKQKRENQQLRDQIANLEVSVEQRLESRDKLHALGLENQIKALESKMDEAIESGDVEAAKQIRAELRGNEKIVDSLNEKPRTPAVPATPQANPIVEEWNDKNAWIHGDTPKAAYAQSLYGKIGRQMISERGQVDYMELLRQVDDKIASEYPDVNLRRRQPRQSEGGSPPGKPKAAALTMRDLNQDEMSQVKNFGAQWAPDGKGGYDEAKILEMVTKARADQ